MREMKCFWVYAAGSLKHAGPDLEALPAKVLNTRLSK